MPPRPPPYHGLDQCRARQVATADRLLEDTAVLRPSSAHFHRLLHRVEQLAVGHTGICPVRESNPQYAAHQSVA